MPSRRELANAIRFLSMDAVQKANSGHPGAPMGMADIAEVLWNDYLKHNPKNGDWADRDRFVLSNGHGSMLIYSLLHLSGYPELTMDELKQFRQLHSKTPGHPEYGYSAGIETTTGPLGQGITNAVGLALGEKILADRFNKEGHDIVDHHTYVFAGDGCLMEGVSHEACSLAGTWGLGKLIVFYDDNGISIDGDVEGWFTDNTPQRFEAYGWQVIRDVDGHDGEAVKAAIEAARADTAKPTLICCKTVIGFGAPNKQGGHDVHGAALGDAEITAAREHLNWPHAPFEIPDEVYAGWNACEKGEALEKAWSDKFAAYKAAHPELAAEFERRMSGDLPESFGKQVEAFLEDLAANPQKVATRKSSEMCLNVMGPELAELAGGSADLAGSNNTIWKGCKAVSKEDADGNYIHYGVREFGMTAIMNGLALHGGFIPYGGTFLVFSDYARNAVRMAALMKIRSVLVYTHDSIGLGEDGPTHQPVEHVTSLRIIPNMDVWRPCDTVETAVAWRASIERKDGPSSLVLTRQGLPQQERSADTVTAIQRGGYVLSDCDDEAQAVILATGSEVEIAMDAAKTLNDKGIATRVVSMPATTVFDRQDAEYKNSVIPANAAKVAVEAGVTDFWTKYVGMNGKVIGIDRFGESAPIGALYKYFGITSENVVKAVESLI